MSVAVTTATGWIVNQSALATYDQLYRVTGNRESAMAELHGQAKREDWARKTVAAEGKSWTTHLAKFSGAVLPR